MELCQTCSSPFNPTAGEVCPGCGWQPHNKVQGFEPLSPGKGLQLGGCEVAKKTLSTYREILEKAGFGPDIVANGYDLFARIKPFVVKRGKNLRQVLCPCVEYGAMNAGYPIARDKIADMLDCQNSGKGYHIFETIRAQHPEIFDGVNLPKPKEQHGDVYIICYEAKLSSDDAMRVLTLYKRFKKDKEFRRKTSKVLLAGSMHLVAEKSGLSIDKSSILKICNVSLTSITNFKHWINTMPMDSIQGLIDGVTKPFTEKEYQYAYDWYKTHHSSAFESTLHERISGAMW